MMARPNRWQIGQSAILVLGNLCLSIFWAGGFTVGARTIWKGWMSVLIGRDRHYRAGPGGEINRYNFGLTDLAAVLPLFLPYLGSLRFLKFSFRLKKKQAASIKPLSQYEFSFTS